MISFIAATLLALVSPLFGQVSVTINANTGAVFTVSGTGCAPGGYTTPQTLQWAPGAIVRSSLSRPTASR